MRAVFLLVLVSGCASSVRIEPDEGRIAKLEAELEKERSFSRSVREQLVLADSENEAKAERLKVLEPAAKKHDEEVRKLQERINILDTENSGKAVRALDLQRALDRSQDLHAKFEADLQALVKQLEVQLKHIQDLTAKLEKLEKK
jgi:transcription initiation factor IIF auxiliary subunit